MGWNNLEGQESCKITIMVGGLRQKRWVVEDHHLTQCNTTSRRLGQKARLSFQNKTHLFRAHRFQQKKTIVGIDRLFLQGLTAKSQKQLDFVIAN